MLDGFVICNDYVLMHVVQVESSYLMRGKPEGMRRENRYDR